MTNNAIRVIASVIVIALTVYAVDLDNQRMQWKNTAHTYATEIKQLQHTNKKIPTVMEVQTKLQTLGYYQGEIDGIIGPKMKDGWKRAVNDAMAVQHFPKYLDSNTNTSQ